jgi:ectoine hydroxylase-related dioxygenase (phytanoyl-CoA dioxygenase family)
MADITAADEARRAKEHFDAEGFCVAAQLLEPSVIPGACDVMDSVIAGEYPTGVEPLCVDRHPDGDPAHLARIDQPQMADLRITELVVQSGIGEFVAAMTGADLVQVWAMQLIRKPSTSTITANVGWHQDEDYWTGWWEGEVFTCWLALSDVTIEAGPVRFVRGSHHWGFLGGGNFFLPDLEASTSHQRVPAGATWEEAPAVIPAGGASFHHRLTLHGSGPNTSGSHRRSYAVHLRTDRARMLPGLRDIYQEHITDPTMSPVLFER